MAGTGTKSRQDDELTELLTKLYTMQEELGAKPKSSEEEKKAKAENVATMGSNKKTQKKGSRFLELKNQVLDRLKTIHQLLKDTKAKEAAGYGGDNAKDIIKMQAEIREHIRQAGDEWTEMEAIYKKEARKKKSKFTVEELEVQSELVQRLHAEIEKVKEAQMRGYARGQGDSTAASLNTQTLYSDSGGGGSKPSWAPSGKSGGGGRGGGGAALTDGQRQQMLQLEERDADFDRQLDEIGEGIQDLAEIAQLQGEEVQKQSAMLDQVDSKMIRVKERMEGVNKKMKDTLEEVGRASDKLCVDIMCIVLAVGFGAVMYNFVKNDKK